MHAFQVCPLGFQYFVLASPCFNFNAYISQNNYTPSCGDVEFSRRGSMRSAFMAPMTDSEGETGRFGLRIRMRTCFVRSTRAGFQELVYHWLPCISTKLSSELPNPTTFISRCFRASTLTIGFNMSYFTA